ncbi:hypothetical protein JAAARDRAFT_183909 [Jaapia argillacea MUCL 33604]|uniref:Uncharacterized protein n=1 Tax=Jaapia argillacea MUCL 33604 TaxID=933084 RepID=A0A067PFN1_9AGAM|nr:hypothetical protein JAAARDRAFT_183909 [Jaapia argillacea MUCL 33604]
MDKATSVLAAMDAGKMPTQKQMSSFIDSVLKSQLVQIEPSEEGAGELSMKGKVLCRDLREILEAYKKIGENKNSDNQLQEAFWHLASGDLSKTSLQTPMDVDEDEATRDARAIQSAINTFLQILYSNLTTESTSLLQDFASFTRLALADAAEVVERAAGKTKEGLRGVEDEVQEGERDSLGRKKRKLSEEQQEEGGDDTKVKFEKTMDAVKEVGSSAIGVGQNAAQTVEDVSTRTGDRFREAYFKICERAQNDPQYRQSISTLFDICEKWLTRGLDTASDVNKSTSLDSFINDPTPEKHIITAIRCVRTIAERLAGDKSLDDLFAHVRTCAVHVRQDEELKEWFRDFFAHIRKSLDEPGYIRSDESQEDFSRLRQRWDTIMAADSDEGRKWKADVDALKKEIKEFQDRIDKDQDVRRIRRAYAKFGKDLEEASLDAGAAGFQLAAGQASWFWQDVFNVYLPRVIGLMKDIPIPRTEYKDQEVEFVLEDLDISSFSLLPGHVFIRNITDIDINAPKGEDAQTAVGTFTHIHVQGVELALREVSFYYHDKNASLGPSEFTGIMELTLPPQAVDIDLRLRMIPNSPAGLKEREKRGGFHKIESIDVKVTENISFTVRQSNHPMLVTVFKPMLTSTVRDTLAMTLREQIRVAIESTDKMAWDIGNRAEVFSDAGLSRGPSYIAGFWSELGKLARQPGGLTSGWRATGTGVIKDDKHSASKFAMGAEPQILSGEKRGPKGTFSESLGDKMDVEGGVEGLGAVAQQAKETVKEGIKKVRSFKQSVEVKAREEKSREGWQTSAFDVTL